MESGLHSDAYVQLAVLELIDALKAGREPETLGAAGTAHLRADLWHLRILAAAGPCGICRWRSMIRRMLEMLDEGVDLAIGAAGRNETNERP